MLDTIVELELVEYKLLSFTSSHSKQKAKYGALEHVFAFDN